MIYGVAIAAAGLLGLVIVISGLKQSPILGLIGLVVGCAVFLTGVTIARIWLEAAVVFFRIADHMAELVEHEAEIALNTAGSKARRLTSNTGRMTVQQGGALWTGVLNTKAAGSSAFNRRAR